MHMKSYNEFDATRFLHMLKAIMYQDDTVNHLTEDKMGEIYHFQKQDHIDCIDYIVDDRYVDPHVVVRCKKDGEFFYAQNYMNEGEISKLFFLDGKKAIDICKYIISHLTEYKTV